MNIQLEKNGNVSAQITINMAKDDYEAKVTKTLKDFSHKAQMPGFRPGKVPMSLVRKMYGVQAKAEEVNKLLRQFDQMLKMMRQFTEMGKTKKGKKMLGRMKMPF